MKKIIYVLLLLPIVTLSQTTTENYIKTTIYKGAGATLPVTQVTYFDGLGRPIQQVAYAQSNSGKDIITHIEYDAFGRQAREFLPYANSAPSLNYNPNAGTEVGSFYNNIAYENTLNPYSQKEFEASPLNRVMKQAAPGNPWVMGSGHEIKLDYQTNIAGEVKYYKATATWNATKGLYDISIANSNDFDANQLYKMVTKDENWTAGNNNTTEEFKNKEGQVVLKRTYNAGDKHDTYYVYDKYGNLTYVLPPLTEDAIDSNTLNGMCYQYKYDYRNRLVEKKLPGKQWEFIVYDKLNRVVAIGPTLSPFSDITTTGWMVSKYDAFGRTILTAWYPAAGINSASRKTLQDAQNAASILNETKTTTDTTVNGIAFRYSNTAWPTSAYHILTVNYYDDYNFANMQTIPTAVEGQAVYYNNTIKPIGFLTGTWVRVLESSTLYKREITHTLFDYKARPIRTFTTNHLGGYTQVDSKLDFVGKVEYTKTIHKRAGGKGTVPLTIKDTYEYSAQDRLLLHKQQINTFAEQLIAKNTYDELGQLTSKNVGGTDVSGTIGLQKVDYNYNIRGWLKGINDIANLGLMQPDLFSFKLNYNDPLTATPLYNGNISETLWKTGNDDVLRKYKYSYDNLNRLTDAIYEKPINAVSTPNSYNESLNYDKNGNITYLSRYGGIDTDGSSLPNNIDELSYTYHRAIKNQLMKVQDYSRSPQGFNESKDLNSNGTSDTNDDYAYDLNGNMTKDDNKGITNIIYNHLNLPIKITFGTSETIDYIYNAVGVKIQKKVTNVNTAQSYTNFTDYLSGFVYEYKSDSSGTTLADLKFFPHPEGYVEKAIINDPNDLECFCTTIEGYRYVFQFKDHLGNIRLSYQDKNNDGVVNNTEIVEENNYYPFGMKHSGYNNTVLSTNSGQKLKYNGKELQDELGLNLYDYSAMLYDPATGRRNNIDPKAEQMRRWSTYAYCFNNPMRFTDPDGMKPTDWIIHTLSNGKQAITYDSSIKTKEQAIEKGYKGVETVFSANKGHVESTGEKFDFKADGYISVNGGEPFDIDDQSYTTKGGINIGENKSALDAFGDFLPGALQTTADKGAMAAVGASATGLGAPLGATIGAVSGTVGATGAGLELINDAFEGKFSFGKFLRKVSIEALSRKLGGSDSFKPMEQTINDNIFNFGDNVLDELDK
jgi:RHS repeat-associated protein